MSLSNVVSVSALVCLMTASAVYAGSGQDRDRRGRSERTAQPRGGTRPPVVARRQATPPVVRRQAAPPVVRRYAAPVVRVAPYARRAYRPVYRPGLGIGIYIGSPYGYRYPSYNRRYYGAPYAPYPYPSYGYPYPGHTDIYAVPPPDALYGGVRLDVTPRDAAVFVDGYYAGVVDDFDGVFQRIALEPGPHRFEVSAPGHETLTFDINVRPNQTVHYRGDMPRVYP